jgi:LysM repeat protein
LILPAVLVVGLWLIACGGAAEARWSGRYSVRPGDSLSVIAEHYRVSVNALAGANGLNLSAPLLIGTVLHVPGAAAPARITKTYVVRPGDTLSGIALQYHTSVSTLAKANRLDPAGVLLIGARLRVPTSKQLVVSDPYDSGSAGYDVSYPGCGTAIAAAGSFGVVGLNGGRPFTDNPCFAAEWAVAGHPSVYVNTAYDDALLDEVTGDCRTFAGQRGLSPAVEDAYALGCSEAAFAVDRIAGHAPLAIWLDVEPDNTWSSSRRLNRSTVNGFLDRVVADLPSVPVGVYSNGNFWRSIVGGWRGLSVPEWVSPEATSRPGCERPFAAGPVWLEQRIDGSADIDVAC